jgi:hypothetical protein
MSQAKLSSAGFLAMLAALIVCGIAASGASALEWELTAKLCAGGTNVNFCYEKTATELAEFKGTGEFEILPLLGTQHILFEANLGGTVIHKVCGAVDAEHSEKEVLVPDGLVLQQKPLEASAVLEFHLRLLECKLEGTIGKKCKIPSELVTVPLTATFDGSSDSELTVKPVAGTIILSFPFENNGAEKCPATLVGTKNVVGEVLCFIDKEAKEALEDLEEHELICDPAKGGQEGKLFFATSENPLTLLAEVDIFILNVGTDLWSISNEA